MHPNVFKFERQFVQMFRKDTSKKKKKKKKLVKKFKIMGNTGFDIYKRNMFLVEGFQQKNCSMAMLRMENKLASVGDSDCIFIGFLFPFFLVQKVSPLIYSHVLG